MGVFYEIFKFIPNNYGLIVPIYVIIIWVITMARIKEFDRETVLRRAMKTFWKKGYEGTSISDLTETMNISRSSLYDTYGDKQNLFIESLKYYLEANSLKRAEIFKNSFSVKQGITDYLTNVVSFLKDPDIPDGCFFTNAITNLGTSNDEISGILQYYLEKQAEDFFLFFQQGQENGEITEDKNPKELARFFIGLIRGLSVIAKLNEDRDYLKDIVKIGLRSLD